MSRKVEKLLDLLQDKRRQRQWDRELMAASPGLREEYLAAMRRHAA